MQLLNITSMSSPLNQSGQNGWTGYIVENGFAFALACSTYSGIREYAKREGFDGTCIGGPSVPWSTAYKG